MIVRNRDNQKITLTLEQITRVHIAEASNDLHEPHLDIFERKLILETTEEERVKIFEVFEKELDRQLQSIIDQHGFAPGWISEEPVIKAKAVQKEKMGIKEFFIPGIGIIQIEKYDS